MNKIDFKNLNKVHFIGIGGISMSALANILLSKNITVSGSDSKSSALTDKLVKNGAVINFGHSADNVPVDASLVVYTAAISDDNPEYVFAKNNNIPVLKRSDFLGQIMTEYETAIGVSGTHGKTTTTSMISQILLEGNEDPTILVGGILDSISGNLRIGGSQTFITEACEYTNSFLSFFPTTAVILNICEDHMDFFKDINDIRESFKKFASLLPDNGTLIINSDIDDISYITDTLKCNVVTYGMNSDKSLYSASNIKYDSFACGSYDLIKNNKVICNISLNVPGSHNISNSLAAIAVSESVGMDIQTIKNGLEKFTGTERRFQKKGEIGGITIVDDYAHHPDEIKATLSAAKLYPHKKIWCVFQPHTYSRTKAFLDDFAAALSLADNIVLTDIYAAREKNTFNISSRDIETRLKSLGKEVIYLPSFDEIESFLLQNCSSGDLLITMGAGDVVKIGEKLLGIK